MNCTDWLSRPSSQLLMAIKGNKGTAKLSALTWLTGQTLQAPPRSVPLNFFSLNQLSNFNQHYHITNNDHNNQHPPWSWFEPVMQLCHLSLNWPSTQSLHSCWLDIIKIIITVTTIIMVIMMTTMVMIVGHDMSMNTSCIPYKRRVISEWKWGGPAYHVRGICGLSASGQVQWQVRCAGHRF